MVQETGGVQEAGGVQSRAAEWLERRRAKRQQLVPDQHDAVEGALTWIEVSSAIEIVRNGWKGFKPVFGGLPSGSRQAIGIEYGHEGVGVRHPQPSTPNRFDFNALGAANLYGYSLLRGETSLHKIAGTPFSTSLVAYRERNAREDFYGIGADSLERSRTEYEQRDEAVGTSLWWRLPRWFALGGSVWYRQPRIDVGVDASFPGSCVFFTDQQAPGCERQPDYLVYDAAAEIDWRNPGKAVRGGFYAVHLSTHRGRQTSDFDFDELRVDVQQYFPFLYDNRVIALRAEAAFTEPRSGARVPFYLMPKLGGSHRLRGFSYGRFTDLNALVLQAEYRAEVWMAMDLALFVDAGRVARERADLLESMEVNYGFGFRYMTAESTFLRFDFAFGGDSFRFVFAFDDAYHDPTLARRLTDRPRSRR